jgi:methionine-rich copper-binding protein CopC
MKTPTFVAMATAMLALAGAASAHPHLKSAIPAPDAAVTSSPHAIRITFSEGLMAKYSGIEVVGAGGGMVALGPATLGASNKQLVAAVSSPLAPGTYTVNWRAVGDDTHHTSGHYSFHVKP